MKTAARAFQANPKLAAIQAPLDYYNAEENFLTRQFAIEYAALFHVWIPFLVRLGLPFPLGGTSNHIKMSALKRCDGWDAYNVTEDADMSFRLAALGYDIGYITPPTGEEAIRSLKPWREQRSRWMKGYMQTWLVHMTRPMMPGGTQGLKRQVTLHLTVGLTLLTGVIHVPALISLSIYAWVTPPADYSPLIIASLTVSYLAGMLIGAAGVWRAGKPGLLWHIPFMPLYWLLHFTPTMTAIKELFTRPFYWNKTRHGVTDIAP